MQYVIVILALQDGKLYQKAQKLETMQYLGQIASDTAVATSINNINYQWPD